MKTKQNKQSKLVIAMSAVILVLVALSATLTFAYFTSEAPKGDAQSISFGTLSFNSGSSDAFNISAATGCKIDKLVPGCSVTAKGKAVLTTTVDAYVRVKVTVTSTLSDSDKASILNTIFNGKEIANAINPTGDDATWEVHDGWSYYKTKVSDSLTLFDYGTDGTTITFGVDLGNEYQGKSLTISVVAQAIQADHLMNGSTAISMGTFSAATLAGADAWDAFTA